MVASIDVYMTSYMINIYEVSANYVQMEHFVSRGTNPQGIESSSVEKSLWVDINLVT